MKITALCTIDHDGKSYAPGKPLTVAKDEGERLISIGAAMSAEGSKKTADPDAAEKAAAEAAEKAAAEAAEKAKADAAEKAKAETEAAGKAEAAAAEKAKAQTGAAGAAPGGGLQV